MLIIVAILTGIFAFSTGLASMIPLFSARADFQKQPTKTENLLFLGDVILFLLDCIPVLWLFRAVPKVPSAYAAAREKWRQDAIVRTCFYTCCISLSVMVTVCWMLI